MNRYQKALREMMAKTISRNGLQLAPNGPKVDLATSVTQFLKQALEQSDPEEAVALIKKAHAGDPDAKTSLNALRVEQINNFIVPNLDLAQRLFAIVNLAEDERPAVQVNTRQEVSVRYIGQDGDVRSVKIKPDQTEVLVDLRQLASDEVRYRLRDLYLGSAIAENALRTVDIAFDLALQIDSLAWTLLSGAYGAFTTTGNKSARTYYAHTGIHANNIPSTNDIVLSGNSGSTKMRFIGLDAILKYCDTWGNAWPDGPLRPTGDIFIASVDTTDILSSVTPTGSQSNPVADQVMTGPYTSVDYAGVRWNFIPNNRLASGVCYPVLNKPVGTLFFKPAFDMTYDNGGTQEAIRKNIGARWASKVIGMYIPVPYYVRTCRITYHS